jgi:hypothetical protein
MQSFRVFQVFAHVEQVQKFLDVDLQKFKLF